MDDRTNYIKKAGVQTFFDQILGVDENRLDPQLMADAMVAIIPKDTGLFRNVFADSTADLVKTVQRDNWEARIDMRTL